MNKNTNYMWEEKISKLLLKQSTPAVIWMLVMSLYNFVDTIFIGRWVGTKWIAALSIVFPIQMIIWAFAMAMGIWAASVISRKLWEKKYEYVSKTFGTFQVTNILFSVIFAIFWLIFIKPLLVFFWATQEIILLWSEYFSILLIGIVFFSFNMWNNNIIRSVWHAKIAMIVMVVSAIINIALDPIMIFSLNMWMAWAARATVISRVVGSIIVLHYFFGKNNIIKTNLSDYKIDFIRLKEIFSIWISSLARQVAASGVVIFVNNLLWMYGWSIAIAAYGIVNRALMVFFMPMFGIVQWMQPILWFNHGAWFNSRVREVTFLSIKVLTIFSTLVFAISMLFPWLLLNLFSTDENLLQMATPAMRIIVMLFPLVWFQIIVSWFYQALWRARPAFWFAIMRQVLILLPILIILPRILGLNWIWYSFPAADFIAALIIFFVFRRDLKKII